MKNCPICHSNKIQFKFKNKDRNFNLQKEFKLYECIDCKIVFINPFPSKKEISKSYPKKDYYSLQGIKKGLKTKIKIKLYKVYYGKSNFIEKIIFSPFKYIIKGTIIKKNIKILDIGCGAGQFLYEMKKLGLKAYGLEPGEFDIKISEKEGVFIEKNTLNKTKYKSNTFDLIIFSHVLEHLKDPYSSLNKINNLLKKEGVLILSIPNTNSLAKKVFGKNWYQWDTPRHLINYSNKNIKKVLNKTGFEIKKIRYNSRPSQFSVSLEYLLNIKNKYFKTILNIIFLPLTWTVNLLKKGDQIEIWCKKKT